MDSVTIGCFAVVAVLILVILRIELTNRSSILSMKVHTSDMDGLKQNKTAQAAELQENAISPEVIAAISAAVACIYPGSKIRSLCRAPEKQRSCWQMAGLLENTLPF